MPCWTSGCERGSGPDDGAGSEPGAYNPGMTYTLVLLRHGESTWNQENRFTGWTDVPLNEKGLAEAREAGRMMAAEGLRFDVVHTSLLRRAIATTQIALDVMDQHWLPVRRSWRLKIGRAHV